jgi:Flp pilus assembly pilin Flp
MFTLFTKLLQYEGGMTTFEYCLIGTLISLVTLTVMSMAGTIRI